MKLLRQPKRPTWSDLLIKPSFYSTPYENPDSRDSLAVEGTIPETWLKYLA